MEVSVKYSECVLNTLLSSTQYACAILYFHLWPVSLCRIILHYFIHGMVMEKNWTQNMFLDFRTKYAWNISNFN